MDNYAILVLYRFTGKISISILFLTSFSFWLRIMVEAILKGDLSMEQNESDYNVLLNFMEWFEVQGDIDDFVFYDEVALISEK